MVAELIKKYIADKNITVAIFASMIRVDPQTVYYWFKGRGKLRKSTAAKIEDMTKGEITFKQLMGYERKIKPKPLRGTQLKLPTMN
jgi:DNA-binding transcriptional regulator YdaS (Cro superfamily)